MGPIVAGYSAGAWPAPSGQWAGYGPGSAGPVPPGAVDLRRRFRLRAVILGWFGGLIVGGGLVIGMLALVFGLSDLAPGTVVARHGRIASTETALRPGDCLSRLLADADVATRADVVPCGPHHRSEVLGVLTLPGVHDAPEGEDMEFLVADACQFAFDQYIGESFNNSPLRFGGIPPSRAAWRAGDRSLYCLLYSDDYHHGRGTARGSAA